MDDAARLCLWHMFNDDEMDDSFMEDMTIETFEDFLESYEQDDYIVSFFAPTGCDDDDDDDFS